MLACCLAATLCSGAMAADARRPNILLIYADDQSYKTLSCYPETPPWAKTPHIDRLASQGVRFARAYLGSWCMPSRASMLTGRLPFGIESMRMTGAYPGSDYDSRQCPFWPAEARRQGYHTAQIGKWHTGVDSGWGRDWDYQVVWNRPKHTDNAGAYYKPQILEFNGETRREDGYPTDNYTNWAVDYIRGQDRDAAKPWFLWLCYGAIHGPTTPAPRHQGHYSGNRAPLPADIFGPRPDKPQYLDFTQAWQPSGEAGAARIRKNQTGDNAKKPGLDFERWIQQVNECTLALDEGVGKVMAALDESGQLDNTLILYTADQGFGLGEHGLNQKHVPYDGGVASPLIVCRPGVVSGGQVCPQPVNTPDLVATICATAGIELPWKTHGRDITPLLKSPTTSDWNSLMLMTHTAGRFGADTRVMPAKLDAEASSGVPWWVQVRDSRHKYVRYLAAGETEELYDLAADPEELRNLAALPENKALLKAWRERAIDELRRRDCPFVDSLPETKQERGERSRAG